MSLEISEELLSDLKHNLNNDLAVIRSGLFMLKKNGIDEKPLKMLDDRIEKSAEYIKGLEEHKKGV